MASSQSLYARSIFLNCPYDAQYLSLLHAILFAIYECGFLARLPLLEVKSSDFRLTKIKRLIEESQWSIHDVSRVRVDSKTNLPRFNMPFELGMAVGATMFGTGTFNNKDYLLLAKNRRELSTTLSDYGALDASFHGNLEAQAIACVREYLKKRINADPPIPGHRVLLRRYRKFQRDLPNAARSVGISRTEIRSLRYLEDWLIIAEEWRKLNA
jgi:hypothetical protein